MFPKVVWKRFGVANEEGRVVFLPPAAYGHRQKFIILNSHKELVRMKGILLFSTLFHEFLHHLNNIFNLPLFFDRIVDVMNEIQCPDMTKQVRDEKLKLVLLKED